MEPVAQDKKRRDAQQAERDEAGRSGKAEDSRLAARRRVFLLLEVDREALGTQLRRRVRMRRRYEDLWLVKMVTRLQRDYLSPQAPGGNPFQGGTGFEHRVADWARPWGPTLLLQFQADLTLFDLKLKSSRRWLSVASRRMAEARAAERFASLTTGLADELKAAELTLPPWASGRLPARGPAPRGTARRGVARGRAVGGGRLNLNQVSVAELRSLKLSTPQVHRVLAYRKRLGGYESVEQLDQIPGFPEAVRERLKSRVSV